MAIAAIFEIGIVPELAGSWHAVRFPEPLNARAHTAALFFFFFCRILELFLEFVEGSGLRSDEDGWSVVMRKILKTAARRHRKLPPRP